MRLRRLGQVSSFCWEIMHLSISPQSNRFIKTVHHFLSLCFGDLFIKWDKNEINLQDSKLSSHVGPKNMPSTVDKKSTPDETSNSHTHTHSEYYFGEQQHATMLSGISFYHTYQRLIHKKDEKILHKSLRKTLLPPSSRWEDIIFIQCKVEPYNNFTTRRKKNILLPKFWHRQD